MQITIDFPHVFCGDATPSDNAPVLERLLEVMVEADAVYLRKFPNTPFIYKAGVRYGRTEIWDTIPAILEKGFGDCKSLAPWLVAYYRTIGKPARCVFRWAKSPRAALDFHILVQTRDGFEDPSKVLGMGTNENARY